MATQRKTQPTPGPWETHEVDNRGWLSVRQRGDVSSKWIAHTIGTCHKTIDEANANARLIAAAPEMYEALRLLLADFEAIGAEPWHLDDARAALRKADGDE